MLQSFRNRKLILAAAAMSACASVALAQQSSEPAMLQWFEISQKTIEKRSADFHAAGYGGVWVPPQSRSEDQFSVGYNVYDRFDLGRANDPTLYGTETGLKTATKSVQRAGGAMYVDFILNHSGFRDINTTSGGVRFAPNPSNPGQAHGGGYPGFVMATTTLPWGEYHPSNVGTAGTNPDYEYQRRISGLNDIDQRVSLSYVRNPVAGNPNNIPNPANATIFGRRANVPDANNARFYSDTSLPGQTFTDPRTGGTFTVHPYNTANPLNGTPVAETVNQYLARSARWMIQSVGIDGFRVDTAKHVYPFVLDWFDRGVFRADPRTYLDGSQRNVFSFLEYYDGNAGNVNSIIRKDIVNGSNTVGGNRDALDFPLFFAMRDNLTGTSGNNNWHKIRHASVDFLDDGNANNGTRGVSFAMSHDDGGMTLGNVAYAFTLMRPGKALVYTNAHEFGTDRTFPQNGRDDALGGFYGNTITKLVELRNTHGRGNFAERWLDDAFNPNGFSNVYVYERQNSALVALNGTVGNGVDTRNGVQTSFAPGTHLVELTGNADDPSVDTGNVIPNTLIVNGSGQVNVSIPRNNAGVNKGYVIYGLQNPKGSMSLSNVASTIAGESPGAANNGTQRLSSIDVITANSFDVSLNTTAVTLPDGFRDQSADGDRAYVKLDEGRDVNNNGTADFRAPGSTRYGFENFSVSNPGYNNASGAGSFSQTIDATQLSEGYHYVTARAFRQRSDGGPDVFSDFKRTVYVDRLKPESAVDTFNGTTSATATTRDLVLESLDQTATQVNVFLDLAASVSDATILSLLGSNNATGQIDRDLFARQYTNVGSGNHVVTIVTREITGNTNIQRIAGVFTQTTRGLGLGDLNFDGQYTTTDVGGAGGSMEALIYPNGAGQTNLVFSAPADLDANGLIDSRDLYALRTRYRDVNAPAAAQQAAKDAVLRRGDMNQDAATNVADIDFLYSKFGDSAWRYDLDVDGWPVASGADRQDMDVLIKTIFETNYGDTDLDGVISFDDYARTDSGFLTGNNGWANGDFDGNGVVNFDDYALIDFSFLSQNGPGAVSRALAYLGGDAPSGMPGNEVVELHFGQFGASYANGFVNAVPEPGTALFTFGGLAASAASARRRRRQPRRS